MKKSILSFISAFTIPYIVLAIFIFLIDPYYVFHAPWFQMEPVISQSSHYIARGLIRNFDYDLLVCGTSMCENIHPDYVNTVFNSKCIKVVQHGSYSRDLAASLKQAARSGKTQTVIMGLDTNVWQKPSDGYRIDSIPLYAVTTPTLINTAPYLFSIDNLEPCFKMLKANWDGQENSMNSWWIQPEESFCSENVAAAWKQSKEKRDNSSNIDETLAWENYNNLIEGVEECADKGITIKFFIPPYSMAEFSLIDYRHDLNVYKEIWRALLQYDNVELYAVQFDTELIQHFEWYRNTNHYNGVISDMIIDDIANKKFFLTPDNIDDEVEKFKQFLDHYNWESLEAYFLK